MEAPDVKLAYACRHANVEWVVQALDAGADVNRRGVTGLTPLVRLMHSINDRSRSLDACLDMLLRHGAQAKLQEWSKGETPLIALCRRRTFDRWTAKMAEKLVKAAPTTINHLDHRNLSALAYCCIRTTTWNKEESRMVRLMLSWGANTNRGDYLPLVIAAQSGQRLLAIMLLRAGADPTLKDSNGQTALPIIVRARWKKTIADLAAKYPYLVKQIQCQIKEKKRAVRRVSALIENNRHGQ